MMMAQCASVGKVSNIHNRHKDEFTENMTCILKVRTNGINNSLRALCLAEEPSGPYTRDRIKRQDAGGHSDLPQKNQEVVHRSSVRQLSKADKVTVLDKSKT